jgi:hypothetical protein
VSEGIFGSVRAKEIGLKGFAKIRFRHSILAALCALISSPSLGQAQVAKSRWVNISEPDYTPILLDTTTKTRDASGYPIVWLKVSYAKPQIRRQDSGKPFTFKSYNWQVVIDCLDRKLKTLQFIYYDANGNISKSYPTTGYEEWHTLVPESNGEAVVTGYCKSPY